MGDIDADCSPHSILVSQAANRDRPTINICPPLDIKSSERNTMDRLCDAVVVVLRIGDPRHTLLPTGPLSIEGPRDALHGHDRAGGSRVGLVLSDRQQPPRY